MPTFARYSNLSLYYEIHGHPNSEMPTCLLIGGLSRDHTVWRKLLPLLKKQYRVVIFDHRDAGQSVYSGDEYGIADLAEDVAGLIKDLKLQPVYLIGHSMGGFMAMHLASTYPKLVKGLILAGTAVKQGSASIEYLQARIDSMRNMPSAKATTANKEDILRFMPKLYCKQTLKDLNFVEEILVHESNNPYPQSAQSFIRQAQACINHDATNLLEKISCPTLIVVGEEDQFYPLNEAKKITKIITHATVEVIAHAAHMIQLEQPHLFYKAIEQFISRNET